MVSLLVRATAGCVQQSTSTVWNTTHPPAPIPCSRHPKRDLIPALKQRVCARKRPTRGCGLQEHIRPASSTTANLSARPQLYARIDHKYEQIICCMTW